MEQTGPPSPAPSNDDIYHDGLHHLIRHNNATSYPRDQQNPEDNLMGHPASQSRYGTPDPQHDRPYDQSSPYSHRAQDGQISYQSSYDPTATPYASMSGMTHQYSGYVAPNALPEFGYDYYP
ncbi:hypothetical protein HYQ45_000314 [Verticillium longisporum]|uniref:Uncharacterized protein n=1 Tax=Verticillium longisporum TaxID=100787 RepID=A0A8I3AXP4_VERLO|nr:hypothetical protein HYQ45_000314 [Verticillium longisporum]